MAGDCSYVRMKDVPTTEDFLSTYCVLHPALGPAGREEGIKGIKGVLALKGLLASGQDLGPGPLLCPTLLCCGWPCALCGTFGKSLSPLWNCSSICKIKEFTG